MKNSRSGEKIKLTSIDELLGVVNEESSMEIEIKTISPFKGHRFYEKSVRAGRPVCGGADQRTAAPEPGSQAETPGIRGSMRGPCADGIISASL